jgi:hypothetical protein
MSSISVARFLYFRIFSASFLIIFLCHEFATSINTHVPLLLLLLMFLVVVVVLLLLLFQYGEVLNTVGSILHVG